MDGAAPPTATDRHTAFAEAARAIVSANFVRPATLADAIHGVQPQTIVEPGDEQELAAVLRLANEERLAVLPRGGGTKLAWGNPPKRADVILSTTRLNKIIEHAWADLTVSVEAGCSIKTVQQTLARHGQRLALDALWPDSATVGGLLSTNDSGALRLRFGALRDLIIGVTIALPDGTLASSGGRVVKNVAGYDLPKLVTGAFGTLGVITRAVFRVHPLPKESLTISCAVIEPAEAQRLLLAIQDSQLAHSALQLRAEPETGFQIDVLLEATQAGLAAQAEKLKSIVGSHVTLDRGPAVWDLRQKIYMGGWPANPRAAVAKISILPARIGAAMESLFGLVKLKGTARTVVQATGIGALHLEATHGDLNSMLKSYRASLEADGGSLVIAHHPKSMPPLEAFGSPGDALPLMQAVKRQFDPNSTLNPGRFVGGI